jgi:hypothetical protein
MAEADPPSSRPLAAIYCIGSFSAVDGSGHPLGLQTQKGNAVLAMLALAPRGTRSRAWLRDKLWSDKDEHQGSASLRQALLEIRQALGPFHARVLTADRQSVRLDLSGVDVDRLRLAADPRGLRALLEGRDAATLDFLEGINIDDPEFEDWLTVERSAWADLVAKAARLPAPPNEPSEASEEVPARLREPEPETETSSRRIGLGLLPCMAAGVSEGEATLADILIETIARCLGEIQPIDVYDFRQSGDPPPAFPKGEGPDWLARLRLTPLGGAVNLTLLVYRTASATLAWSQSVSGAEGEALRLDSPFIGNFLAQCVDRLSRTVFDSPSDLRPEEIVARANYMALNLMFRLDADNLDQAERLLNDANRKDPQAISFGLLSYISSFRVGDNLGV